MQSRRNKVIGSLLACAAMVAASGASATEETPANPPVRVEMTEDGPVFATTSGLTLYVSARDRATPGKSQCNDLVHEKEKVLSGDQMLVAAQPRRTCAQDWPPLLARPDARPGEKWSLITREDGSRQWTFDGRPLHTSVKDRKAGDVNAVDGAEGLSNSWKPAFAPVDLPPGIKLLRRAEGMVLTTSENRPIYVNSGAQRVCAGCADRLRPLKAGLLAERDGDWSVVDSGGGVRQYDYKDRPLFIAPDGMSEADIAASGNWTLAVYRPTAGTPPQIQTRLSVIGDVHATDTGMTVYRFVCITPTADRLSCDNPGDAAAYISALCGAPAECSRRWRPYRAPHGAAAVGEWSVMDVADPLFTDATARTYPPGSRTVGAWAYRGRPLFTFVDDEEPGQILGHGIQWRSHSGFYAIRVPGQEAFD